MKPNMPSRKSRKLSTLSGICLAAMVVTAAGETQAQEPAAAGGDANAVRYNRKSGKVRTKDTLDTKFKAEKEAQEKESKRKVNMMEGAEFAKKRAAVAQEIADTQIEQLKRLLKATDPSHPDYPDLLFRLCDHFLEKKAYFENQSGALYEEIYKAEEAKQKGKTDQLKAKQAKFDAQAKESSEQAVKLYKVLVTSPQLGKFKRLDEALYFYAFELGQLKRETEMKDAYIRLIQDFPNSQYIPNAYLSFADYYFGQNKIGDALQLYEKVITFKDSPVYAYALYKMAWCHLNPVGTAEPRYDLSLDFFVKTIQATLEGRAGSEANAKQLRRDARRDLVQAYSQAGKPTKAWEFFQKIGDGPKEDENMSRKMMELLAVRYFGQGMYTESTFVYEKLQELYAEDPQTCEWQGRIVINALATDNKDVQWKETAQLGEYWTKFKDGDYKQAIKRKCRDETLDTMKQMATVWHDEAEKTKNESTYALAELAYEGFLKTFPKDKDAYEIQMYYAELLWARAGALVSDKDKKKKAEGLDKFRKAHDEFIKVLEINPEGKFTQDAAYAQMLAMKNALEYDETGGQGKACKTNAEGVCVYQDKEKKKKTKKDETTKTDANLDFPESEYSEDEKKMLEAYDTYQKYVKDAKDPELPKIVYHRAKIMMVHNKFTEARPLLEEMVVKFDGTIYAAWCSEMLLDVLTIRWTNKNNTPEETVKASDDLEKWALKMQKMKVYTHPEADELKAAIPRLLAGIGWKKGMAYRDAGAAGDPNGFRQCAEQFLGLYNEYGDEHEKASTLVYNAGECYEAAYLLGQSVRMRKLLIDKFPTSEHFQGTLSKLAGNYQAIAMYDKAAERMEAYAEKYTKDKESPDFLRNAYLFRLGLGQNDQAQANLSKYEGLYKKDNPELAAKIFWSKHDILKTEEEKLSHAQEYLKIYGKTGGADRRIVAEATIGQILWRQSCDKGLLHDSCMSIQRKVAQAGEKARQRAQELKRKDKKLKEKKGGSKKQEIPTNCGQATAGIITVYPRNKKKADEAQRYFDNVIKASRANIKVPEDDRDRIEDFRNAVAMAQVYKADQQYEEYVVIEMPGNLSFFVEDYKKDSGIPKWEKEYKEQVKKRDDSIKRFTEFYQKKGKLGADLQKTYDSIVEAKQSPYWMLAAAARSAMVSQNYADQLYRAEVPKEFKTEEEAYAYCDELSDKAQPHQDAAVVKFSYCLEKSTTFQFFNDFSRLCEEELQQRDADKYPSTAEIFGVSQYTASRPDRVQVQTDLEGDRRKPDIGAKPAEKPEEKKEEAPSEEAAE
jgi:TolA-binding protein